MIWRVGKKYETGCSQKCENLLNKQSIILSEEKTAVVNEM